MAMLTIMKHMHAIYVLTAVLHVHIMTIQCTVMSVFKKFIMIIEFHLIMDQYVKNVIMVVIDVQSIMKF